MVIESTGHPKIHWNYYLALEADCQKLARYIEFAKANYSTYSVELAHLLIAAASEVDVIAKLLCQKINPSSKAKNIYDYRKEIFSSYPKINNMKVRIPRYELEFSPWFNEDAPEDIPKWWGAYNNVKHQRNDHFMDASLQHSLNALGGLLIMLLYYYKEDAQNCKLEPAPSFLVAPVTAWNFTDGSAKPCFDL